MKKISLLKRFGAIALVFVFTLTPVSALNSQTENHSMQQSIDLDLNTVQDAYERDLPLIIRQYANGDVVFVDPNDVAPAYIDIPFIDIATFTITRFNWSADGYVTCGWKIEADKLLTLTDLQVTFMPIGDGTGKARRQVQTIYRHHHAQSKTMYGSFEPMNFGSATSCRITRSGFVGTIDNTYSDNRTTTIYK